MASNFTNNAEGADGTTVTTSSATGGSDQWTTVVKDGTAIVEYDTARRLVGASSIRVKSTATADRAHTRWSLFSPTPTSKMTSRFYAYIPSFSGTCTIYAAQGASSVRVAGVAINNTGRIVLTDESGTKVATSTSPITWSSWTRFEIQVDLVAPKITVKAYAGHATTTTTGLTVSVVPAPLVSGNPLLKMDRVVFGKYSTSLAAEFWLDEMATITESVTPIGPISGGAEVHYDISGNYVDDGSKLVSWTINTLASTGTTTLASTSGPAVAISETSPGVFNVVNPAASGTIVLTLTATSGGSVSQTITLDRTEDAPPSEERPYRWIFQGGVATDIANWE